MNQIDKMKAVVLICRKQTDAMAGVLVLVRNRDQEEVSKSELAGTSG